MSPTNNENGTIPSPLMGEGEGGVSFPTKGEG
jgi:hypothetical protein